MPATADSIAADYPYLAEADQAKALEIHTAIEALMKVASSAETFPNASIRKTLGAQLAAWRSNAVQMIGQQ